jgi:hypothetical protein
MSHNHNNTDGISQAEPDQGGRLRDKRLSELEAENTRLKYEVAVLRVDQLILKEVVDENSRSGR